MEFVTQDEMEGIKDLQLILKDEKLSKRVPVDLKKEFEQLTSTISSRIETALTEFIKQLEESRSKSKEQALDLIQDVLDAIAENNQDDTDKCEHSILCIIVPGTPEEN